MTFKLLNCAVAVFLISPQLALASYSNDCLLHGVAVTTPKIKTVREEVGDFERVRFNFKIRTAEEYGRVDSGCAHHVGKTISIELINALTNPPTLIKQGDHLSIINHVGDDSGGAVWGYFVGLSE